MKFKKETAISVLDNLCGDGLNNDQITEVLKEALLINGVLNCKITALVTHYTWEDAPHYMLDDTKIITTKIVEVEKLSDINEMFTNLIYVKILK